MALQTIDQSAPYRPIEWLVDGLIPIGMLTFIGSQPGVGKTTLLAALAWEMTRDGDRQFLGRRTIGGSTIYVNFDSPTGDGRSVRHVLDPLKVAEPNGDSDQIHILEPDGASIGLGDEEFAHLRTLALEQKVKLIVLDSFMASFPGLNANRVEDVMGPLVRLRDLAVETNAAIVILDHLPKQQPGERPGARGLMGSNAKNAQARSVLLLMPVESDEGGGRHLIHVKCHKMTFAPKPKPISVEFCHADGGLLIAHGEADEAVRETRTEQAQRLYRRHLTDPMGEWIERKFLVELAKTECGLSTTAAQGALDSVLQNLGDAVEQRTMARAGAPLEYRLVVQADIDEEAALEEAS